MTRLASNYVIRSEEKSPRCHDNDQFQLISSNVSIKIIKKKKKKKKKKLKKKKKKKKKKTLIQNSFRQPVLISPEYSEYQYVPPYETADFQ